MAWHPHSQTLFAGIPSQKLRSSLEQPAVDVGKSSLLFAHSLLVRRRKQQVPHTSDINREYNPPQTSKDVGNVLIAAPPDIPTSRKTSEQEILKRAREVLGEKPLSEHQLQFVPQWVIDKSIAKEKENYNGAYEELHISQLPPNANLISSHHFFQLKHEGETDKLRLQCRLVPHGNRDRDKDSVRKDSATAQFPIISIVLSIAAILGMALGSIDVKSAYTQGCWLTRNIFVLPPKGWTSLHRGSWKLLKPAYRVVESGRVWQLAVGRWMSGQGIIEVPGLPQLFIERRPNGRILLAICKVVDDFLMTGSQKDIDEFHDSVLKRFEISRFVTARDLIFNRFHIHQSDDQAGHISMKVYLGTIKPLVVTRERGQQFDSPCTATEFTAYQGLAGSLNFLGHGVSPQASFAASYMQQAVGCLKASNLIAANGLLLEIEKLEADIKLCSPQNLAVSPSYIALSDASHG